MKILNLYCGIGGNRKLWGDEYEVTAIEINPEIAKIYQDFFPKDKVVVGDAHEYLLKHFQEFDFIWSSPPCPTHSRLNNSAKGGKNGWKNPYKFPDMKLYEEIIFLQHFFKGKFVIENVISYYDPLIKPYQFEEHFYWSNFIIDRSKHTSRKHNSGIKELSKLKGFNLDKYTGIDKRKVLRNCVKPEAGLFVFESAFFKKQTTLGDLI